MYTMRSEYGNEIAYVKTEKERDRLISLGFTEVKKPIKKVEKKNATKTK